MSYKYITGNNLYEKQTYMYSEYGGIAFIKEYQDSRQNYIHAQKTNTGGYKYENTNNPVKKELQKVCENLQNGNYLEVMGTLNEYVKSFEVRKRIYTGYDAERKPLKNADFEDYESYLIFAECLLSAYRHTKCLKYFSCLLKLDDTLLSVQDKLGDSLNEFLCCIVRDELAVFYQIAEENGIDGETGK